MSESATPQTVEPTYPGGLDHWRALDERAQESGDPAWAVVAELAGIANMLNNLAYVAKGQPKRGA